MHVFVYFVLRSFRVIQLQLWIYSFIYSIYSFIKVDKRNLNRDGLNAWVTV